MMVGLLLGVGNSINLYFIENGNLGGMTVFWPNNPLITDKCFVK